MFLIALATAILIAYIIQYNVYKKYALEKIEYDVTLSTDEVFEDEDVFMFEEISNKKYLPLPYVKVNTELPEGLNFCLIEDDIKSGIKHDKLTKNIQSIFVMRGNQQIKRRWRIRCRTRGCYNLSDAVMITNDIIGFCQQSRAIEVTSSKQNSFVVLPKAIDIEKYFNTSKIFTGEMLINRSLVSDPLRKCGTRDYASADPMSKINWLSTASHGKLMVNVEEYTQRYQFNIIMNMQSRPIEFFRAAPSGTEFVESCITIAASILDRVSSDNIPVRFICNTPPDTISPDSAAADDEIGSKIYLSPTYSGKRDIITALRTLAMIQMQISTPIEKMLDHILNNPHIYASGGNILFVSPYICERMLNFNEAMLKQGIKVIYYITTTNNNALVIPETATVHFKAWL